MSWLAWLGIAIVIAFIVYFLFFYGRKKNSYRKPLPVARPRTSHTFAHRRHDDDEQDSYIRKRRPLVEDDHVDDYLFGAALANTLNSEDSHVHHRSHYSDVPTPDPEPTSIPGSSHFETGGGFGGDSGFSSGGDIGGSDSGSSGGDSGGGSND